MSFSNRFASELLSDTWMPKFTQTRSPIPGFDFIGSSWHSTYVSEFIFPLIYSVLSNKSIQVANKAMATFNTCLCDLALANLFKIAPSFAPAWICLPAITLAFSQFSVDHSVRSSERDDFADLPYENYLRHHSTLSESDLLFQLMNSAFEIEMLF